MTQLDDQTRREILRQMIRIRVAEERIATLYPEQEMRCPTHLAIGQEGMPAVMSVLLRPSDLVFSGHRSHGHYIAKGGDLGAMFAELYGKATGCAGGKGGSQHLVDLACGFMGSAPILSSTISVGVGAAWAARLDGRDEVSTVWFGDGATEEGAFHESLNFAAVHSLPVVFVCENNLYSVHSPMEVRQPPRPVARLGEAHGMPGITVSDDDPAAMHAAAAEAVARARDGEGPSLIECLTYRWKEHCGPLEDDTLGYRPAEEVAAARARDPLAALEATLADTETLWTEAEAEVDRAVAFAKESPFPEAGALTAHLVPA